MHGLAAQKLADAGAQHGAAIAPARVGRGATALELDFLRAVGRVHLAQQQGAAIAQLPGPHAKLVAAVYAGQRRAARQQGVAAEGLQGLIGGQPVRVQPQSLRGTGAVGHPVRSRQRCGLQPGAKLRAQRGKAVAPVQARTGSQWCVKGHVHTAHCRCAGGLHRACRVTGTGGALVGDARHPAAVLSCA